MKTHLLLTGMLLMLCPVFGQLQNNISSNSKNNADPAWLQQAQKFISEAAYDFKKADHSTFDFYAANPKQRIGFTFTNTGYSVSPIVFSENTKSKNWKVDLDLLHLGRGKDIMLPGGKYVVTQNKSDLLIQYPGFAIEYINNEVGLRQNFIVSKKLNGTKELEVLLRLSGDLQPSVNNNELVFKDKEGVTQLFYKDLKVWDADHKPLEARMELRDDVLAIVVDDKAARYPITIDPLNQTPDWATSADGILPGLIGQLAVDAAYGYSVAGLGDINGDGYDDVAVGAPAMVDLISGTGHLAAVGAVFVYRGSATGLPTTPSAVLQPTTAVAGALFGYSIAGGDINGDGRNDILVGAPMDNIAITVNGNDVTGKVGKAYVFNGATLSTGSSPFLSIQLSGGSIISNVNISVNALFGFSVAVTEDLNADGKKDIIIGAPTYAGIKTDLIFGSVLDVQSGGAFVYLTKAANNTLTQVKLEPIKQSLLALGLLANNINGLLFGYAVDGTGDYNGDGKADVVATAPAGINAGSLTGLLNGKLLQGSAIVYYGSGTGTNGTVNTSPGAVLTATSGGLLTNLIGSIANVANLFGVSVKGVRGPTCARNGNIIVGAPLGGTLINVLGLDLKTGTVSVFKKKGSSPSGYVAPDQVLASPRNSNNILQIIQANLLFGYSLDNICDINCDGYADIIVGEPVSSGVQLLNANVAGGAAYVYYGNAAGLYQTSPAWTLTATEAAFLGINTTSLIGYSVAGAGRVKGSPYNYCILVGSPSRTLDFGAGLLNLGSTLGTIFSLAVGNNGVGKAYEFDIKTCDHQPVAVNDAITTNEDTPVNGNAATNDIPSLDGGNTWTLVTNPSHGTASMNSDGTYTYTPAPNYNGTDQFTYKLCDADNDCSTATVTVTITPVDDVPVAVNDAITTNEDTPVSNTVAGNDTPSGDGGNVWSLVGTNGGAAHGTVTMNPDGTYTYTPAANYNGSDVFTYKLCDADNDCSTATVTVTITPVNDVPVAANDNYSTNEDTQLNGNVSTNDTPSPDCANTWSLVSGPAHGTIVFNANGTFTYNPAANYNGPDAFSYKLCDCDNDCSTATVTITVNPVDDAPIAVNDAVTTNEDTPVSNTVAGNDTQSGDGGNVWTLLTNPSHGSVSFSSNGTYTYTPAANYNGSDAFTYKLCDADNDCSTATVNITVTPVDDAPVAVNDAITTNEDTPVSNTVAGNDTPSGDGGNIWTLVTNPSHGSVSLSTNGSYTYTPAANYNGPDAFTYKLCDADNDCSTATVNITVTPVDDAPIAVNDAITTSEDTPASNTVAGNDTPSGDGGNVWTLLTNPSHGSVSFSSNGNYTYTPAANYNGPDEFTYKLCDADNDCSTAKVSITVTPADDNPIAVNDVITTNEDTPKSGSVAGNDIPSGDCANTWTLVTGPSHGILVFNSDGTFTYTPHANYNGPDGFTYKLCDCENDCSNASVTITVNPVNDLPVAVNDNVSTNEDTPLNGNVSTNDTPSGDCANTWTLVTGPSHGTLVLNANGTFTYTPHANYNGPDAFTYKLCDCENDCSQATVNITVNPVDDVPNAVNDAVSTNANTPITNGSVAGNDTPSGDCANNTWSIVTNPQHGTVTMNSNGTFTYTPAANYSGTDQFTYKLCDCDAVPDCDEAIVTITINSPCTSDQVPPGIQCPSTQTLPLGINCSASLPNYTGLATASDNCSVTVSQSPAAGTTVSGTGSLTVTLTATDGSGNTAKCTFTVNKVDQTAPTIICPSTQTLVLGATCSASLPNYTGLATASDNCSVTVSQSPSAGTTVSGTGSLTVTLTATDGSGNTRTCSFTVNKVDQTAPVITCQQNKTVGCNTTVVFDTPSATDNCGQATVSEVSSTSAPSGTSTVYTKTWKATDASGNTATCSQSITQTSCTGAVGNIYPTSTTCNSYLNGQPPLPQLCYSYKQGKVSNITPGVFFYFTAITAPSSSFTVDIIQTKSCASFSYFAIQQGNQVTMFSSSCNSFAGGAQTTVGQGRINVTNATAGAQYVIAVKYDSKSVQGSPFTGSAPVCQYSFETRINGVVAPSSQASINLVPNCSASAPLTREVQTEAGAQLKAQVNLFPNPAADHVVVTFVAAHTAKSSVEMYDVTGRLVVNIYNGDIEQGRPYQKRVSIKGLAAGMYMIRFRNGEFIETKRLVIAK